MDLQHLRASDGTGEAVLAHIQSVRNPGSTVLDLDNVDNWNSKVVVVTGTPAANGYIAAAGMKVMYGHISAGDLVIDGFAPGYTDNGNTTQEVALVKMCTAWADALVDILGVAHQDNGKLKTTSLDDFFKPSELIDNFVASGGIAALSAGLTGTLSDIVYYINGLRYTKTGIANKVYTVSKDTYVDIDTTGTVTYSEVANNAAAPALAASNIRLAKVVTNGSTITSIKQSGSDSLNNIFKPYKPGGMTRVYGVTATDYTLLTGTPGSYTTYGPAYTFNLRAGQVVAITTTRASSVANAESAARVTGSAFISPPDDQSLATNNDGNSRETNTSYLVADTDGTCTVQGSYKKSAAGNLYARLQVLVMP